MFFFGSATECEHRGMLKQQDGVADITSDARIYEIFLKLMSLGVSKRADFVKTELTALRHRRLFVHDVNRFTDGVLERFHHTFAKGWVRVNGECNVFGVRSHL